MFNAREKGFHMVFANGWTVSVQWGDGYYCNEGTAEIAAWDSSGAWYMHEDEQQEQGWQTPEQVAAFIAKVASF